MLIPINASCLYNIVDHSTERRAHVGKYWPLHCKKVFVTMSSIRTSICVVSIAFFTLLLGQNQILCNNAYECVGAEWTLSGAQDIIGNGHKSLSGNNTSVNGSDNVGCYGSFACSQISFILSDNRIDCYGSHSCTNISGSSYIKAQSYIKCDGANSCQ
eukprot:480270_1